MRNRNCEKSILFGSFFSCCTQCPLVNFSSTVIDVGERLAEGASNRNLQVETAGVSSRKHGVREQMKARNAMEKK